MYCFNFMELTRILYWIVNSISKLNAEGFLLNYKWFLCVSNNFAKKKATYMYTIPVYQSSALENCDKEIEMYS